MSLTPADEHEGVLFDSPRFATRQRRDLPEHTNESSYTPTRSSTSQKEKGDKKRKREGGVLSGLTSLLFSSRKR